MKTQNVVDSSIVDEIFYKINEIYMHHATFITFLDRALKDWDSQSTIGDIIYKNVRPNDHSILHIGIRTPPCDPTQWIRYGMTVMLSIDTKFCCLGLVLIDLVMTSDFGLVVFGLCIDICVLRVEAINLEFI